MTHSQNSFKVIVHLHQHKCIVEVNESLQECQIWKIPKRAGDGACEVVVIQVQTYEWLPRPPVTPKSDILTQDYSRSFYLSIHRASIAITMCAGEIRREVWKQNPQRPHVIPWFGCNLFKEDVEIESGRDVPSQTWPYCLSNVHIHRAQPTRGCPDVRTHLQLSKLRGNVPSETVLVKLAAMSNTTSPSLRECYILSDSD